MIDLGVRGKGIIVGRRGSGGNDHYPRYVGMGVMDL